MAQAMRDLRLTMLGFCALLAATPASAQTYGNTSFPVCLQVFGRLSHIDCSYASIEQCRRSAAGRAAQCIANPYYAGQMAAPRGRHHKRRVY
jgi:Protein of unknown function (DUF3551)